MDKELNKLVFDEAVNLKKYATKEEIEKLDFKNLNGESSVDCIYGQMTGSCHSDRSADLFRLCTKKVYSRRCEVIDIPKNYTGNLFTPIEEFVYESLEDSESLIQFLKGEITESEFKQSLSV